MESSKYSRTTTAKLEGYGENSATLKETLAGPNLTNDPFGRLGAARYDRDVGELPRRYKMAHIIQNELVRHALRGETLRPVVLDLGCGTGNDGAHILSKSRNAAFLGIDYSEHMLARTERKLAQRGYQARSVVLKRDFREIASAELLFALKKSHLGEGICCVISALALHHYGIREKEPVYKLAFDVLPKAGLMVLTDLYLNSIDQCADRALSKELFDIRNAANRLRNDIAKRRRGGTTISELHYIHENRPQVLTEEISLLKKTGFSKIDIIYRDGQLGVLAVQK